MLPALCALRRSSDKRILGGICGGLAEWLGMSPLVVRLAFVGISVLSAAFPGIVVYVVLWFLIPDAAPGSGRPRRSGALVIFLLALAVMFVIIFAIFAVPVVLLGLLDAVS